MTRGAPPTNEVERIWVTARDTAGDWRNLRRPAAAMTRVIEVLAKSGPLHEGEIARRSGARQENVHRAYLPKLEMYGLAQVVKVEVSSGLGHQGGGRPARHWVLTLTGQRLAQALADER